MIDNVSIQIEELALHKSKIKGDTKGTFIESFEEFRVKNEIHDPEDLLEVISDNLKAKIAQDFKDCGYFPKGSKNAAQNNLDEFLD